MKTFIITSLFFITGVLAFSQDKNKKMNSDQLSPKMAFKSWPIKIKVAAYKAAMGKKNQIPFAIPTKANTSHRGNGLYRLLKIKLRKYIIQQGDKSF